MIAENGPHGDREWAVNLTLLRLHDLAQAFGVHPQDLLSELNEHED